MAKNANKRSGANDPTPSVSEMPKTMPRSLDAANAIDNLNIKKGSGKK
jgi:hypothetical protein